MVGGRNGRAGQHATSHVAEAIRSASGDVPTHLHTTMENHAPARTFKHRNVTLHRVQLTELGQTGLIGAHVLYHAGRAQKIGYARAQTQNQLTAVIIVTANSKKVPRVTYHPIQIVQWTGAGTRGEVGVVAR